jgi:hypothetical protein
MREFQRDWWLGSKMKPGNMRKAPHLLTTADMGHQAARKSENQRQNRSRPQHQGQNPRPSQRKARTGHPNASRGRLGHPPGRQRDPSYSSRPEGPSFSLHVKAETTLSNASTHCVTAVNSANQCMGQPPAIHRHRSRNRFECAERLVPVADSKRPQTIFPFLPTEQYGLQFG